MCSSTVKATMLWEPNNKRIARNVVTRSYHQDITTGMREFLRKYADFQNKQYRRAKGWHCTHEVKCAAATGPEGFENRGDGTELRVVIIKDAIKTLPRGRIDMEWGLCESPENKSHDNISRVYSMSTCDSVFYKAKLRKAIISRLPTICCSSWRTSRTLAQRNHSIWPTQLSKYGSCNFIGLAKLYFMRWNCGKCHDW